MRLAGSIDPGSGGGVCTGQRVSFIPAFIAITRAMLSFLLRPATWGISIFGACAVSPGVVDDAAPIVDDCAVVACATSSVVDDAVCAERPGAPADSICSSPLFGLASFAAQPAAAKEISVIARNDALIDGKRVLSFREVLWEVGG